MARPWISMSVGFAVLASLIVVVNVGAGGPRGATAEDAGKQEGKAGAAAAGYKLVAPLDAIMYASEDIFNGIKDLLKEGKYVKIQRNAFLLAELANVYGHASGDEAWEKKEWKDLSAKLQEDLIKLAKAAKSKNEAEVKAQWSSVESTCGACHEKIRDA